VRGHSHLTGASQAVGINIRVGIRIFNIVGGLGFLGGRNHGYGRLLLAVLGPRLLHKLRMQEGIWGRLKSCWRLVVRITRKGQRRGRALFLLGRGGRRGGGPGEMLGLLTLE